MSEAELTAELIEATAGAGARSSRAGHVAATIRRVGGYRWVGIYDVGTEEIAVCGRDGSGPPAHPRFAHIEELCGAAVATGKAVIVRDVTADPHYLTTHAATRSETVVPVFRAGLVIGLIDVESERPHFFTEADRQLLERCAAVIAPLWSEHTSGSQESSRGIPGVDGRTSIEQVEEAS